VDAPAGRTAAAARRESREPRAAEDAARRASGYRGYFSLYDYPVAHLAEFDLTEKRDIYQPGASTVARSSTT
jgi:hypothetical protein